MKSWVIGVTAMFLFSGCASVTNYTPPASVSVVSSKKVDKPFETVWDQLVRELSSDFFVINNIDKNSRLINISFSTNRPSDFVDCGSTSRSSDSMFVSGVTRYDTADSVSYRTTNQLGQILNVNRTTKLEGRANIYVAPEGGGTSVIVNIKYALQVNAAVFTLDGRPVGRDSNTLDFSTKSPSFQTSSMPGCSTKGVIETKILSYTGLKT